jgi:hypothetical protein
LPTIDRFLPGEGDWLLVGHGALPPFLLYLVWDLLCHGAGGCTRLRGELEDAYLVELHLGHEVQQALELLFGLAWEADDEGGS